MLASRLKTALGLLCACPSFAFAADIDGATLSAPWSIPFVGLLLSIALMPLLAPMFWHHHYGKIAAAWALAFLVPFAALHGAGLAGHPVQVGGERKSDQRHDVAGEIHPLGPGGGLQQGKSQGQNQGQGPKRSGPRTKEAVIETQSQTGPQEKAVSRKAGGACLGAERRSTPDDQRRHCQ